MKIAILKKGIEVDLQEGKISEEEKEKYMEAKKLRAKYRKLLSQANKQIAFLKKALNGKEIRSL